MINSSLDPYSGSSISNSIQCVPEESSWVFGWLFITLIQALLNSFLIFVTYRSKNKLRHNYVYAYVISFFTGNFLLSVLMMYSLLNYALVLERYWGSDLPYNIDHSKAWHRPLQLWFAFRRAFIVSLYLINNANVSSLIYGIRDSAYFVGRNAAGEAKRGEKDSLRNRRNKAVFIITMSWSIPLGFTISGLFANCAERCVCVHANYGNSIDYCQTRVYSECSRIWQPLTDRFMLAIVVTWCLEILFIVAMLMSAVRKSILVMLPDEERAIRRSFSSMFQSFKTTGSIFPSAPSAGPNAPSVKRGCLDYFKNPTVKLLVAISGSFFVTSCPLMVVILIDVISVEFIFIRYSVTAVYAISVLYGLVVPCILARHMPTLRAAIRSWLLSFKCCTTSTVRVSKQKFSPEKG